MKVTKQARREAKQIFRLCFVEGVLKAARVRQVVTLLIEKKPRGYPAILAHFQRLLTLEEARRAARVESATPLGIDMQSSIHQNLIRAYGDGLNLSFHVNPQLIGGLRVRVGSDVYDGSVQARLAALQETF